MTTWLAASLDGSVVQATSQQKPLLAETVAALNRGAQLTSATQSPNPSTLTFDIIFIVERGIVMDYLCAKRSLKVIETEAIQKLGCGFLFAFHSNHGDILYRLQDIATYW